ncbi:MAG: nucleoside deaminase [bacterium]|nr:nucleoside deaminase [bacterium]
MKDAIKEAKKCRKDVPIGCAIKLDGKIIASAHNLREENDDITAHAEILAIKEAQKFLKTSRLKDCEIYVTLEPCPMCAWAIIQSGIKTLYFGSYNSQYGSMTSVLNLPQLAKSKIKVYGGIEEDECNALLNNFFESIR